MQRTSPVRRLTPLLSLLLLLASVLACSSPDDPAGEFEPGTDGVLTVATDLPAPGFWSGAAVDALDGGFEYEIARALAERFGLRLEVIELPFERLARGDLVGADLAIAQLTATDERAQSMTFSTSYLPANLGVLVHTGAKVSSVADARRLRWVAQEDTTHVGFLETVIAPDEEPLLRETFDEAVAAVRDHAVDAGLFDLPAALAAAASSNGTLKVTGQFVTDQHLAIALPKDSSNVEAVNSALRQLAASGELDRLEASELEPVLGRDPGGIPVITARTAR